MCEIETALVALSTIFPLVEVLLKQCEKFEAFDEVLMALIYVCGLSMVMDVYLNFRR